MRRIAIVHFIVIHKDLSSFKSLFLADEEISSRQLSQNAGLEDVLRGSMIHLLSLIILAATRALSLKGSVHHPRATGIPGVHCLSFAQNQPLLTSIIHSVGQYAVLHSCIISIHASPTTQQFSAAADSPCPSPPPSLTMDVPSP